MFKLPFGILPAHWGTAGRTREIMKAEYELEGHALEKRLLEIKKEDFDEAEYTRKVSELDYKYKLISTQEYHRSLTLTIKDEGQRKLAVLELDHREGKLGEIEYSKQTATLKGEPWVTVLNMDFNKKTSLEGSFELDWNELFVEKLKQEGYSGPTSDNIVNAWFMEVCRNIAMEEFDGTGDFTADSEANLEAVKRWGQEESFPKGRKGYK